MDITPLRIGDVEQLAHSLAVQIMDWDEHIPDFGTCNIDRLESCLQTPFMSFEGLDPYPTLIDKAVILMYLIIKNHPFQNGNKRLAVSSFLVFLLINNQWITTSADHLYEIAIYVAKSKVSEKDNVISTVKRHFESMIIDFDFKQSLN